MVSCYPQGLATADELIVGFDDRGTQAGIGQGKRTSRRRLGMPTTREGRTALITGGGTGIGRGIALALSANGASVVVSGRNLQHCEETVSEIARRGGTSVALRCDVGNPQDVDRTVT